MSFSINSIFKVSFANNQICWGAQYFFLLIHFFSGRTYFFVVSKFLTHLLLRIEVWGEQKRNEIMARPRIQIHYNTLIAELKKLLIVAVRWSKNYFQPDLFNASNWNVVDFFCVFTIIFFFVRKCEKKLCTLLWNIIMLTSNLNPILSCSIFITVCTVICTYIFSLKLKEENFLSELFGLSTWLIERKVLVRWNWRYNQWSLSCCSYKFICILNSVLLIIRNC